jgi:hypothetical protein
MINTLLIKENENIKFLVFSELLSSRKRKLLMKWKLNFHSENMKKLLDCDLLNCELLIQSEISFHIS